LGAGRTGLLLDPYQPSKIRLACCREQPQAAAACCGRGALLWHVNSWLL